MNYYSGTITIYFDEIEAEDREDLKYKIDEHLPQWMKVENVDIDEEYSESELKRMYRGVNPYL